MTVDSCSHPGDAVDPVALLEWVDSLRSLASQPSLAGLLDFGGVNAMDLLLAPTFSRALNLLRSGQTRSRSRGLVYVERASAWAFNWRANLGHLVAAGRSGSVAPTDVLLWPREITHLSVLEPVARALSARGASHRTLTSHLKCFADSRRQQPETVWASVAWPKLVLAARREGQRRARQLKHMDRLPIARFNHAHADRLERMIRKMLRGMLPVVSVAVANARAALDRFQPRVLVVGNDLTLEGRAACRIAKLRGVPTASFMHGNITGSVLHARHCADRYLVQGEAHRQELLRCGLSPGQVVVCGAPYLDGRTTQTGHLDPRLSRGLGLRPGQPWILVATSGPGRSVSHRHHAIMVDHLRRLAAALPAVPLVVKLHRKDRARHYDKLLRNGDRAKVFVISKEDRRFPYDIFDWLQGCPLVLTINSTVAVEAMLMDVPVITMDYCNEVRRVDFINAGATVHVRTADELLAAVSPVLTNGLPADVHGRARKYVAGAYDRVDGRAAERGAEVIRKLGRIEREPAATNSVGSSKI